MNKLKIGTPVIITPKDRSIAASDCTFGYVYKPNKVKYLPPCPEWLKKYRCSSDNDFVLDLPHYREGYKVELSHYFKKNYRLYTAGVTLSLPAGTEAYFNEDICQTIIPIFQDAERGFWFHANKLGIRHQLARLTEALFDYFYNHRKQNEDDPIQEPTSTIIMGRAFWEEDEPWFIRIIDSFYSSTFIELHDIIKLAGFEPNPTVESKDNKIISSFFGCKALDREAITHLLVGLIAGLNQRQLAFISEQIEEGNEELMDVVLSVFGDKDDDEEDDYIA